jgi:hypothetical protein
VKTLLVGFGFKARHGKDTVAGMVAELLPQARVMPFAFHLKALARCLGMKRKNGLVLQALGTEVMRALNPNVWIELHESWVEDEQPAVALIPDVRFENEVRYIARHGGLLYRIDRLNEDGSPYLAGDRDPNHASETELGGKALFDRYYTVKSGDFEGLRRAAIQVSYDIRDRLNRRVEFEPLTVADVQDTLDAIRNDEVRFDCATGAQDAPAEP